MKSPISHRKGIPFFHPKTELEFQQDRYERYDPVVLRQSALHLADEIWESYPMQAILDYAAPHYPQRPISNILEIGCGVGRWIAQLAQVYSQASCWGIDYSYQMLKRAHEFWVMGKEITIDLSHQGFSTIQQLKGLELPNLNFGLAKASQLPFDSNSQELIVNSFLLDRLDDPISALQEMHRILHPNGKLIVVTPLNFDTAEQWDSLYPPENLRTQIAEIGFELLDWQEELFVSEPLDRHGNALHWKCLGLVAGKGRD